MGGNSVDVTLHDGPNVTADKWATVDRVVDWRKRLKLGDAASQLVVMAGEVGELAEADYLYGVAADIANWWYEFYERFAKSLHLHVESSADFNKRLGGTFEGWAAGDVVGVTEAWSKGFKPGEASQFTEAP